MSQIVKKFIGDNEVGAAKVRLENDSYLRIRNAADDGDVNVLKLDASNNVLIRGNGTGIIDIDATTADLGLYGDTITLGGVDTIAFNAANSSDFALTAVNAELSFSADIVSFSGQNSRSKARWYNTAGTNYIEMWAPTGAFTNTTYQLPADGTNGQVLTTDGAGVLSWSTVSAAAPNFTKQTFTLIAGDITNQYIDLAVEAAVDSINFMVKGAPVLLEGASHDYSVSYTGGVGAVTRITFLNDIATGGPSALIAGDIVQVQYVEA